METNERKNIFISLKNDTEIERGTQVMLEEILGTYELSKYVRCREVIIEQGASGKAFPLIRLSAWKTGREDGLLAQFIHEQLHWIEEDKEKQMVQAMEELKNIFPRAPIDKPEGGGSERSTYCHLIVCRLELLALKEILGEKRALDILSGNTNYTWIRKIVIDHGSEVDRIIEKYFPEALHF